VKQRLSLILLGTSTLVILAMSGCTHIAAISRPGAVISSNVVAGCDSQAHRWTIGW
jgi:hypothetical protein